MRLFKKSLSFMLVIIMVLGLATTAMAAPSIPSGGAALDVSYEATGSPNEYELTIKVYVDPSTLNGLHGLEILLDYNTTEFAYSSDSMVFTPASAMCMASDDNSGNENIQLVTMSPLPANSEGLTFTISGLTVTSLTASNSGFKVWIDDTNITVDDGSLLGTDLPLAKIDQPSMTTPLDVPGYEAPPAAYGVSFTGGTGATGTAPTVSDKVANATFTLPANTFSKAGYTFAGWHDGTRLYAAGATYTMPAEAVIFTAQWTPAPVTGSNSITMSTTKVSDGVYEVTAAVTIDASKFSILNGLQLDWSFDAGKLSCDADSLVYTPDYVMAMGPDQATADTGSFNVSMISLGIPVESGTATFTATYTFTNNTTGAVAVTCSIADAMCDVVTTGGVATVTMAIGPVIASVAGKDSGGGVVIPPNPGTQHTLTFNSNGGSAIAPVTRNAGTVISLKEYVPARSGFTFGGWYSDSALTTAVTSVTLNSDVTVYAKWVGARPELNRGNAPYISGKGDGIVAPDANMTRAEVAQMFYNLLVSKAKGAENTEFNDVQSGTWYYDAITTLASHGIINGYTDGSFRPDGSITRAEFVAIASRFGELTDGTVTFNDVADGWAYDYIANAVARGWVNGYPDGSFKPEQSISRAEVIKITNAMLDRVPDKAYIDGTAGINPFTDLDAGHWAYYEVMEATMQR